MQKSRDILHGGMTNVVELKNNQVIKRYISQSPIQGFGRNSNERIKAEFTYLSFFSELGISPKPISLDLVNGALKIEYFEGETIQKLCDEGDEIPEQLVDIICKSLNSIHIEISHNSVPLSYYFNLIETYLQKNQIKYGHDFTEKIRKYIYRINSLKQGVFNVLPMTVVHGDFQLSNILVSMESNEYNVIDWEFGSVGTPYLDLGTMYAYGTHYTNIMEIFEKNYKFKPDLDLVKFFSVFRIIKLTSFVSNEMYSASDENDKFSIKYMSKILNEIISNKMNIITGKPGDIIKNLDQNSRAKVCIITYNKEGKFLLLKRRPDEIYPNIWEFPGGKLEEEELLEECVKRELEEETGIKNISDLQYICATSFFEEFSNKTVYVFYYSVCVSEDPNSISEHVEFGWFDNTTALEMIPFEGPKLAMTKM